jgi:hypothetical protein
VAVGVEVRERIEVVVEPLSVGIRFTLGKQLGRASKPCMPGDVQSGEATIAATLLIRSSIPARVTAASPPNEIPPATTVGPAPSVSIAQSITRKASSVVWPRIGHL